MLGCGIGLELGFPGFVLTGAIIAASVGLCSVVARWFQCGNAADVGRGRGGGVSLQ